MVLGRAMNARKCQVAELRAELDALEADLITCINRLKDAGTVPPQQNLPVITRNSGSRLRDEVTMLPKQSLAMIKRDVGILADQYRFAREDLHACNQILSGSYVLQFLLVKDAGKICDKVRERLKEAWILLRDVKTRINMLSPVQARERDMMVPSSSSTNVQVFISHAKEDKATIAIPLRDMLHERGITAFVDEMDLSPGGDAQQEMFAAMESAHIGLMVLSPQFVAREWPMKELLCFLRRREEAYLSGASYPIIIPFFYRLGISELYAEPWLDRLNHDGTSLYVSTRFFERSKRGDPEADIVTIQRALRSLHRIQGVRNDFDATNASDRVMHTRRESLLKLTTDKIVEALSEAGRRSA